jgi:hypothetical protein
MSHRIRFGTPLPVVHSEPINDLFEPMPVSREEGVNEESSVPSQPQSRRPGPAAGAVKLETLTTEVGQSRI